MTGAARALCALALLAACARPAAPPPHPQPSATDNGALSPELVEYEPEWRGTSFGAYLLPKVDRSREGAIDVVFHFHAAQMADKEWRSARLDAIVVSAAFGMGSAPYERAFQDPARFGRMLDEVLASAGQAWSRGRLRLRRLGIVSFSAGFGAVKKILGQEDYFDRVDALVLLDSLHTSYTKDHVADVRGMDPYVRFANEAKTGRRVMVMTHSSIKPPDYPSSTESTAALLDAVGVARVDEPRTTLNGMRGIYRAEMGGLHAFGFRGETAKDHMDHLAVVGELVREYVARRWAPRN